MKSWRRAWATASVLVPLGGWTLYAQSATGRFINIDPPGAVSSSPTVINDERFVAGYYSTVDFKVHGYVRNPGGRFQDIDFPGAVEIQPTGINKEGTVVGYYRDPDGTQHGFLRTLSGSVTILHAPDGSDAVAAGVNDAGTIVGNYRNSQFYGADSMFEMTSDGTFFNISGWYDPRNIYLSATGINSTGVIIGVQQMGRLHLGFRHEPDGSTISVGHDDSYTQMAAINTVGTAVGTFADEPFYGPWPPVRGFLLTPDGTFTTFDGPGATYTSAAAINPAGAIAGTYSSNSGYHGYVRTPDGQFTTLDYPGASETRGAGITAEGVVTGTYETTVVNSHGFLWLPRGE